MKNRPDTFCVLPWMHMFTSPSGRVAICCIAREHVRENAERELNLQTHSFEEIWNSSHYRDIRRRMYAGERLAACQVCYLNEEHRIPSYRQWANEYWLTHNVRAAALEAAIDGSAERGFHAERPISFDLRMGNLCNLKCRMCGAGFSSQIEKDPIHSAWHPNKTPAGLTHRFGGPPDKDWSESPLLFAELRTFASDVELINLAGGEPTINRTQTDWLRYLCETGRAKSTTVTVWTNLTNVQDDYFEILQQFKHASLCLSVDGFGPVYEYIRYPARWSQFERNATKALGLPRIAINVVPVLQAYNILNITDLYRWADEYSIDKQLNVVEFPDYLRASVLPLAARKVARERLEAYLDTMRDKPGPPSAFVQGLASFARRITDPGYEVSDSVVARFREFTEALDRSRGQSLEASCPELYGFLREARRIQA